MMRRFAVVTGLVMLAGWGCGPPAITPVAPPGMEFKPMVPEGEEEVAEALGETRSSAAMLPEAGTTVTPVATAEPTEVGSPKTLESGLVYETLKPGDGAVAEAGRRVAVHYTGTLTDGTEFDSSQSSGRPFEFVVGAGGVIKGWDLGIAGMKVGERRKLTVPAPLAYGNDSPTPKIPPNSTLVFDVELLSVK